MFTTPTVAELQEAELIILKEIQSDAFTTEMRELAASEDDAAMQKSRAKQRELKKKSDLYRLDPFIDKHGILRVGGRIRYASIDYGLKHPVLIPKDGHIPNIIAKGCHEAKHQGRGLTLDDVLLATGSFL